MKDLIDWKFDFGENIIIIKVQSLKCKSIKYEHVYTTNEKYPYCHEDVVEMKKIRNELREKVSKEHENMLSDSERTLRDLIYESEHSKGILTTEKFIKEYRKELIKLLKRL